MVRDTSSSKFPWDQIKADSMRNICRELGLKHYNVSRSDMIDFLQSVSRVGLPRALNDASDTASPFTARTSRKRVRETTASTTSTTNTPLSLANGAQEYSPTKRHKHGLDVVSDYNTRYKSDRRGHLSDPGLRRRGRPTSASHAAAPSISALAGRSTRSSQKRRRSAASPALRTRSRVTLGEPVASDETQEEQDDDRTIAAKRRRTFGPVSATAPILRTRKQQKEEESISTPRRVGLRKDKRTVRLNGVTTIDGDDSSEVDADGETEASEEEAPRRVTGRSPKKTAGTSKYGTRRKSSASASPAKHRTVRRKSPRKIRPKTVSPRKARPRPKNRAKKAAPRARARARPGPRSRVGVPSSAKLVFDGVHVPPVSKAVLLAWKKETMMEDEDADGEVDEEVPQHQHAQVNGKGKEQDKGDEASSQEGEDQGKGGQGESEVQDKGGASVQDKGEASGQEGEEREEYEGREEPNASQEKLGENVTVEEQAVLGDGEDQGKASEAGDSPKQPEEDQMAVDQREGVEEESILEEDTSSLGHSNKENEAPDQDLRDVDPEDRMDTIGGFVIETAAEALFGSSVTATVATTAVGVIDPGEARVITNEDENEMDMVEDMNAFIV